ncbi:hypothetical protein EAG14_13210 [Acidovorax sp. 1608163]|uniref:SRPBCC family protein n=1 Tax=Acidovorax sp. 1608163 TaxID=2478662 RepID=UPI000EF730AC|nr:SRPBCC family protein [Acidovorax sp. 1608163]AYM98733.1 hypothetical protein EAG14_13210 [Acidovorax sp. 1608163]
MAHQKLTFPMPARADLAFDAFHYHHWRAQWDPLVSRTHVQDGAPCPSVGAISENTGAGALRALSMRTQFVSYDRPMLAAAKMVGRSFPFTQWAASMRHQADGADRSQLIYTYTFEVGPAPLRWVLEPVVHWVFARKTKQRFARLAQFLAIHAQDIAAWQQTQQTCTTATDQPSPTP